MKDSPLAAALHPLQRALRRHDAARGAAWGSVAALGIALALTLAARRFPLWTRATLLGLLSLLLLCPLWGALWGAFRPQPVKARLQRLERATGLAERLSTAWELHTGQIDTSPALKEAQREETLHKLRSLDARKAFPVRIPRAAWLLAVALLLSVSAALALPNPQERLLAERAALQKAAAAAAQEITAQIEKARDLDSLAPVEREALIKSLETARQTLSDPDASNEAQQAALLDAEQQFAAIQQAQEAAEQQLQEALASTSVELTATERPQALVEALQRGDFAAAEAEARQLSTGEALTPEEAQSLGAALEQLADATERADPTFSAALAAAAEKLEAGETAAGFEALTEATLQRQEATATQEELAALQAGLQSGREQLAAAQASTSQTEAPGISGQSGGARQQHSEDSGSSAPYGPEANARIQESGSEITLPRAITSGESPVVGPGEETTARVPYSEVYPTYAKAAEATLARQPLPPGLRSAVHTYFGSLNPEGAGDAE